MVLFIWIGSQLLNISTMMIIINKHLLVEFFDPLERFDRFDFFDLVDFSLPIGDVGLGQQIIEKIVIENRKKE